MATDSFTEEEMRRMDKYASECRAYEKEAGNLCPDCGAAFWESHSPDCGHINVTEGDIPEGMEYCRACNDLVPIEWLENFVCMTCRACEEEAGNLCPDCGAAFWQSHSRDCQENSAQDNHPENCPEYLGSCKECRHNGKCSRQEHFPEYLVQGLTIIDAMDTYCIHRGCYSPNNSIIVEEEENGKVKFWRTACRHNGGGEYVTKEKATNLLKGWESRRFNAEKIEEIRAILKKYGLE